MNNIRKTAIFLLLVFVGFYSCEEGGRYEISSDDKIPPAPPVLDSVRPLSGGAEIFYTIPDDRDVIGIEASFTATNGKLIKSAASFFAPCLRIVGLPDTLEHTVQLYALDRAGNKSDVVDVRVKPLEPAYSKVAKTLIVKPAFGALMLDWKNELQQDINIFVDIAYSDNGTQRSLRQAFSSNDTTGRKFIKDLNLPEQVPVSVQVSVEDRYGNLSEIVDKGPLHLKVDEELDKSKFVLPYTGDQMGGVFMASGDDLEGRTKNLFDGVFDYTTSVIGNIALFAPGLSPHNSSPWDIFIDLGARYELSRITTHQYWTNKAPQDMRPTDRGQLYADPNVQIYNMYYWDGDDTGLIGNWELISQAEIAMPTADMSISDMVRQAMRGDECFMYPDDPGFTPATRYFRYQHVKNFPSILTWNFNAQSLSEITLYGRKAK